MIAQYTDKELEQIARAFARADAAKLKVSWGYFTPDSGMPFALVTSQRPDHAPHRVFFDGTCDCEAMQYKRPGVVMCVHIATIALRFQRMRKRGTAALARRLTSTYSA